MDLRQSPQYAKYIKNIGWRVDKLDKEYVYSRKIPFVGTTTKIQRPRKLIGAKIIEKFATKQKSKSVVLEPSNGKQYDYFLENGFAKSSASLPTKTLQLDLNLTQELLLSGMHAKTRYNVGLSERKGVMIEETRDIDKFIRLWHKNSRLRRLFIPESKNIFELFSSFGSDSKVFIARHHNRVVAGLMTLSTKESMYYMYAFTSFNGKSVHAPTLVTWKAILSAKKAGKKVFDFDGIYDERYPIKSWKGFSRFKKGFGGKEVEYPGALIKKY